MKSNHFWQCKVHGAKMLLQEHQHTKAKCTEKCQNATYPQKGGCLHAKQL